MSDNPFEGPKGMSTQWDELKKEVTLTYLGRRETFRAPSQEKGAQMAERLARKWEQEAKRKR